MSSYLSRDEAEDRLLVRYGMDVWVMEWDLDVASDVVDRMGPFFGTKYEQDQERAFPRWSMPVYIEGESPPAPESILDAVALLAAAVKSQSDLDSGVTDETAVVSDAIRRVNVLLRPYQRAQPEREAS